MDLLSQLMIQVQSTQSGFETLVGIRFVQECCVLFVSTLSVKLHARVSFCIFSGGLNEAELRNSVDRHCPAATNYL